MSRSGMRGRRDSGHTSGRRTLPRAQERVLTAILGLRASDSLERLRPVQAVYPRARPGRPYRSIRLVNPPSHVDPPRSKGSSAVLRSMLRARLDPRVKDCLRRKSRREMLFAMRVAGRRGVGRGKSWKRTYLSNYRCGG